MKDRDVEKITASILGNEVIPQLSKIPNLQCCSLDPQRIRLSVVKALPTIIFSMTSFFLVSSGIRTMRIRELKVPENFPNICRIHSKKMQ